jgi:uncharacterized repeat protein (TIGR03837 family)
VRAQWAARPFAWHIYPQDDEAHWVKLNAFLAIYAAELGPEAADGLRTLWREWNRQTGAAHAWQTCQGRLPILTAHAQHWAKRLSGQPDLASTLVQFCEKPL